MERDLHNHISIKRAISPVSGAADNTAQVSRVIDRANFQSVEFLIAAGALADADATFTTLVEHGDVSPNDTTLSDAAAVPDSQLLGLETAASFIFSDDDKVFKIGYVGDKRYTRLTITPAANTGAWLISAIAVLFGGRFQGKQPAASGSGMTN